MIPVVWLLRNWSFYAISIWFDKNEVESSRANFELWLSVLETRFSEHSEEKDDALHFRTSLGEIMRI